MRAFTLCGVFTLDSRCDRSFSKLIGNVFFPNTMFLDILCVPKKTFPSLDRSLYHYTQGEFMCHVGNNPFEEQTNSFFLNLAEVLTYLKRLENQLKMLLELCIVHHAQRELCLPFN